MAITIEFFGRCLRVVDTDRGVVASWPYLIPTETVTEHFPQRYIVAAGAADVAISFGGVAAAKVIALYASAELTYKLNGGTTAIPLEPLAVHFSDDGDFTALTVSNPDAVNPVNLDVLIGG